MKSSLPEDCQELFSSFQYWIAASLVADVATCGAFLVLISQISDSAAKGTLGSQNKTTATKSGRQNDGFGMDFLTAIGFCSLRLHYILRTPHKWRSVKKIKIEKIKHDCQTASVKPHIATNALKKSSGR